MTPQNTPRPTKAQRTATAREQARKIREQHQRKERRNRLLIGWGIVAAVVAIVLIGVLVVVQGMRPAVPDSGKSPANVNQYGGAVIGADGKIVSAGPAHPVSMDAVPEKKSAQGREDAPKPPGVAEPDAGEPSKIVLYVDLICPACGNFEAQYSDQLAEWRDSGEATVEYRVLGFLDNYSTTNYSSRAANAAAAVLNKAPKKYDEYLSALFEQQPEEGSAGLDDDKLNAIAESLGVTGVKEDIQEGTFRPYVKVLTEKSLAYGVKATPTVFVDGEYWNSQQDGPFPKWAQKILDDHDAGSQDSGSQDSGSGK